MAFILGTILFVVVAGWVDAGLPWPDPKSDSIDENMRENRS